MANINIAILGKEVLPIFYPIREYTPHIVYLIGTAENRAIANKLQKILKFLNIECYFSEVSAFDIKQVRNECERIVSSYTSEEQFIFNLTGGTKLMAIGAFIVAQNCNSKIIYTDGKEIIDIVKMTSQPISQNLDNKIIFLLQNQKLKSFDECNFSAATIEDSKKIMDFRCNCKNVFERLMRQYSRVYNERMPKLLEMDNIRYTYSDAVLSVTKDSDEILSLTSHEAYDLLFKGRWWETIVANSIYTSLGEKYRVCHNLIFSPSKDYNDNINDKNEIDVLVNMGNTLMFIECKSGMINQDNIYKMDYVRNTYGSDKSKSVLISFCPVNPELREKARDAKVSVIAPKNMKDIVHFVDSIPSRVNEIINKLEL